MRIIEHLIKSVRDAAKYNSDVQVPPACILWPDKDRQWETVIPRLQAELPELLVLGVYEPEKRTGPAIWLRCVIGRGVDDVSIPEPLTPIFYLPGVGRQDLRAVDTCPDFLKPLAELQYRGVIWSQINSKDWTLFAFLKSDQGGLGLDVARDNDAKHAMQLSLHRLLDEEVELLNGKRLDKDYFNTLLSGGDPVRDLLQWLDQGDAFKASRDDHEWKAFVEVVRSQFVFNPENDGLLAAAEKLAERKGPWAAIWERFCEAPKRYPQIPAQIRKCPAPNDNLFWLTDNTLFDGWPQWNDDKEKNLQKDLKELGRLPSHEARKKILALEKNHGRRRALVWAELGEAPLACALEHLTILAEITSTPLSTGTLEDLASGYTHQGWKADHAVLHALSLIDKPSDVEAVFSAIRSVYLAWLEDSARHLQNLVYTSSYPGGSHKTHKAAQHEDGECILFVDGLRFDLSKCLGDMLAQAGCAVSEHLAWAALPSVTATGKPAVAPVSHLISGITDSHADFEPGVSETGQSLKGGYHLKKLMKESGWVLLEHSDRGDGQGKAWCEFGDLDHEGHERGWKIAKHTDALLTDIKDRVISLLSSGWKHIRIVTDHGWLLMPGGLPKIDLPVALTENKWGRCASLKPGAACDERLYPWYWNPDRSVVLADGVSCFKKGEEYTHGGLSLQECLTLQWIVSPGESSSNGVAIEVTDIVWAGLRCKIAVEGPFSGLICDIRMHAGNPESSVIMQTKPVTDKGMASVVVENEDLEGRDAFLVLLDKNGSIMSQVMTIIGQTTNGHE